MRTLSLVFSLAGLAFPLSAQSIKAPPQVLKRPPEIEAEIQKLGRFPLFDLNRDGWDDIWLSIFPKVDTKRPTDDLDGDGKSNFEEMLDHQDPFRANKPMRELTPAQIEAQKKAVIVARKISDQKKFQNFQALLLSRGVLTEPLPIKETPVVKPIPGTLPIPKPPVPEPAQETSCIDAAVLDVLLNPQRLFSTLGGESLPKILTLDRLSNGHVLLAWEGDAEKLYAVEWTDDLIHWHCEESYLPTVDGIGTWGHTSHSPKRFYRVIEDGSSVTTRSDASGGNGTTTFGGTVTFSTTGTTLANTATVVTHLPGDVEPSVVELYIDGERYGTCEGGDGTYTCNVSSEDITRGPHVAYARIDANIGTTPSPENPAANSPGTLRTPETTFENEHPLITGIRLSEDEINTGDPDSPTSTILSVEYPEFEGYGGVDPLLYSFRLEDENGNIVREWTGSVPSLSAGQLDIEWDGTDSNGASLPAGPYYMNFFFTEPSDSLFGGPILIKNGVMPFKILALVESQKAVSKESWTQAKFDIYGPEWKSGLASSGSSVPGDSWGPWGELEGGAASIIGGLQGMAKKLPKARTVFWQPYNKNSDAQPWKSNGTTPAAAFLTGNPFNSYDLGLLIGHGIASTGGTYTKADSSTGTKPPQHYFPFIKNPTTGETVWIESGNMAEKFGASGQLKWMFIATCNYFRVEAHNPFPGHDIYSAMKTAGTLPMGNGLHVLCAFTTSCDVEGRLGTALSQGLLQQVPSQASMTVVEAWTYACKNSANGENFKVDPVTKQKVAKQVRNARSIYWPECENDTIKGAPNENITNPTGPFVQTRLEETDSQYP